MAKSKGINPSVLGASVMGLGTLGPNVLPSLVPDSANWPLVEGTIHYVDVDEHTCIVVSDSGCTIKDVSWASPMFTCMNGGGIYVMPEAHSRVIVGRMSNGMWYILGYIPMFADFENYSTVNGRKDLQQGDIMLCTPTGTSIEIRKLAEQIVLRDGPNYIFMETTGNRISTHSERMTVRTNAGVMTMETDAQFRTTTTAYLKRKVDDEENFVKLEIGYLGLLSDNQYGEKKEEGPAEIIFHCDVCNKARVTIDTSGVIRVYGRRLEFLAEEEIVSVSNGSIRDKAVSSITHQKADYEMLDYPLNTELNEFVKIMPEAAAIPLQARPTPAGPPTPSAPTSDRYTASPASGTSPDPVPPGTAPVRTQTTNSGTHKGVPYKEGVITLRAADGTVLGTYEYLNGKYGAGSIPAGTYTIKSPTLTSMKGMTLREGGEEFGYLFRLNDVYDPVAGRMRDGLCIHPDANPPGTLGCIGIKGGIATQKQFWEQMNQVVKEHGGSASLEFS